MTLDRLITMALDVFAGEQRDRLPYIELNELFFQLKRNKAIPRGDNKKVSPRIKQTLEHKIHEKTRQKHSKQTMVSTTTTSPPLNRMPLSQAIVHILHLAAVATPTQPQVGLNDLFLTLKRTGQLSRHSNKRRMNRTLQGLVDEGVVYRHHPDRTTAPFFATTEAWEAKDNVRRRVRDPTIRRRRIQSEPVNEERRPLQDLTNRVLMPHSVRSVLAQSGGL